MTDDDTLEAGVNPDERLPDEPEPQPEPQGGDDGEEKPDAEEPKPEDETEGEEDDGDGEKDEPDEEKPKRRKRPGKFERRISRLEQENRALMERVSRQDSPQPVTTPPKQDDFETYEDFLVAKAKHEAKAEIQQEFEDRNRQTVEHRREQAARERVQSHQERCEDARDKFDDFDDVAFDPDLPISDAMAHSIMDSEHGPEIQYHLGKHPAEARKIAQMNPLAAARELGKLEVKLTTPAPKKVTSAPPPVPTVKGGDTPSRDPSKMGYEEYRKAREAGQIR
jgi:hypothetical protein